jgi:pilus assembly protein CpaE
VKRLTSLLGNELGIAQDRVVVIINRYQRRGEVTLEDFRAALPGLRLETLPNDYRSVFESINLGVPLLEHEAGSALAKSLTGLVESVTARNLSSVPRRRGPWSWLPGTRH